MGQRVVIKRNEYFFKLKFNMHLFHKTNYTLVNYV